MSAHKGIWVEAGFAHHGRDSLVVGGVLVVRFPMLLGRDKKVSRGTRGALDSGVGARDQGRPGTLIANKY